MKVSVIFLLMCLLPLSTIAQTSEVNLDQLLELSLEDLMNLEITTATKTAGKLDAAPSVLDVITAEQIRQRGYQTLGQLLNDVANNHEDRANWGIGEPTHQNVGFGFRFDTGQNILILFNGQRLNAFLPGNRFGGEEYLLQNIERIEIIKGPGSSLYGTGAFTAVINIISKKITSEEGEKISVASDYIPTSKGVILNTSALLRVGTKGSLSAALRAFTEDGQSLQVKNSLFGNQHVKDGVKEAIDAEVFYNQGNFNIFAKHTQQQRNTFTGFNGVNPSSLDMLQLSMKATSIGSNYLIKTSKRSDLKLSAGWHNDNWTEVALIPQFQLNAQGTGLFYGDDGLPMLDTLLLYRDGQYINTPFFIDGQGADTRSLDGEIQYTLNYRKNNNIVLGVYIADDRIVGAERPSELNLSPLGFVPFRSMNDPSNNWLFDLNASRQTLAAFAQMDYQITDELTVTGGVRFDNYSGHGILSQQKYSETNPRLSLVYDNKVAGTIKAVFGTATRIPNGFETLSSVSILGNPSNRPERIRTYQLQWINNWSPNWRTEFGVFRSEITNRLETNAEISDELRAQGFIGQFINIGSDLKQVNNGIDGRLVTRIKQSTLTVTATKYFGSDDGYGNPIAYIPQTMMNFDYTLPFGKFLLNAGGNYRGDFTKSPLDPRPGVKNYFIARMNISFSPKDGPIQLRLMARNLFNTTYQYPSSSQDFYNHFPARKIELQLGLTYSPKIK
jgi:outer membrane receptor for ferrienterochelin and colicins